MTFGVLVVAVMAIAVTVIAVNSGGESRVEGVLHQDGTARADISPEAGGVVRGTFASVEFPPGSVQHKSVARLSPSRRGGDMPGFAPAGAAVKVELSGASLVAPATVRLRVDAAMRDRQPVLLRYSEGTGWEALESELQGDDLVAQTGHFSDFLVGIRKLGDKLAEKLIPITDWIVFQSGLLLKRTTPPVCANGTNAFPKWLTITDTDQDENSRVRWCTEVRDDKLVLRVRGNRPYAQLLALRDLVGGSPLSSDPFTMPISTAMGTSTGGRFFWVRSDTQLDIVFSQPTSGPAVQTIKVDPIPDLAGTIGVKLAQEALKESPDALSQILGNWDCITRIARARVPMPDAEAIANAFALADECLGHLLPPKAKLLLGAKNAVTQVPDYATDMANGQPQIDFVVGTRREPTTTTSTSTTSSTTTTSTTVPPSSSLALAIDGIGPILFRTSMDQAMAGLTAALGPPDYLNAWATSSSCLRGRSGSRLVVWGELAVEFDGLTPEAAVLTGYQYGGDIYDESATRTIKPTRSLGLRTPSGAGLGTAGRELDQIYGTRIIARRGDPSGYPPPGYTLTVGDTMHLFFTMDANGPEGRVEQISAGFGVGCGE